MAEERPNESTENHFSGRFVILTHDYPALHWDLMLESGGVLRTWRLLEEPTPDSIIVAEPLSDHRLHYLDYEGPVSGDRGTVVRWDHGRHETKETPTGLHSVIKGQRMASGTIALTRDAEKSTWTFRYFRLR